MAIDREFVHSGDVCNWFACEPQANSAGWENQQPVQLGRVCFDSDLFPHTFRSPKWIAGIFPLSSFLVSHAFSISEFTEVGCHCVVMTWNELMFMPLNTCNMFACLSIIHSFTLQFSNRWITQKIIIGNTRRKAWIVDMSWIRSISDMRIEWKTVPTYQSFIYLFMFMKNLNSVSLFVYFYMQGLIHSINLIRKYQSWIRKNTISHYHRKYILQSNCPAPHNASDEAIVTGHGQVERNE